MHKIIKTTITTLFFILANTFLLFSQNTFSECKQKAEQGDANAQYNLGWMYDNGESTLKDSKQAFYWYKKSAEQENANAQQNLGWMYDNGEGTLKDSKQAFYW